MIVICTRVKSHKQSNSDWSNLGLKAQTFLSASFLCLLMIKEIYSSHFQLVKSIGCPASWYTFLLISTTEQIIEKLLFCILLHTWIILKAFFVHVVYILLDIYLWFIFFKLWQVCFKDEQYHNNCIKLRTQREAGRRNNYLTTVEISLQINLF